MCGTQSTLQCLVSRILSKHSKLVHKESRGLVDVAQETAIYCFSYGWYPPLVNSIVNLYVVGALLLFHSLESKMEMVEERSARLIGSEYVVSTF